MPCEIKKAPSCYGVHRSEQADVEHDCDSCGANADCLQTWATRQGRVPISEMYCLRAIAEGELNCTTCAHYVEDMEGVACASSGCVHYSLWKRRPVLRDAKGKIILESKGEVKERISREPLRYWNSKPVFVGVNLGGQDMSAMAGGSPSLKDQLDEAAESYRGKYLASQQGGRKDDDGKDPWHLAPIDAFRAVVKVLAFGANKYSERNWEKGMAYSRLYAATLRHLTSWWEGEASDPETGMSHLWHAACCTMFLVAFELRGIGADDRPKKGS